MSLLTYLLIYLSIVLVGLILINITPLYFQKTMLDSCAFIDWVYDTEKLGPCTDFQLSGIWLFV